MTLDLEAIEQMANTCDAGGHVVPCATVLALVGEVRALREALGRIAAIEDKMDGGDWDEIEEARRVAREEIANGARWTARAKEAA